MGGVVLGVSGAFVIVKAEIESSSRVVKQALLSFLRCPLDYPPVRRVPSPRDASKRQTQEALEQNASPISRRNQSESCKIHFGKITKWKPEQSSARRLTKRSQTF